MLWKVRSSVGRGRGRSRRTLVWRASVVLQGGLIPTFEKKKRKEITLHLWERLQDVQATLSSAVEGRTELFTLGEAWSLFRDDVKNSTTVRHQM